MTHPRRGVILRRALAGILAVMAAACNAGVPPGPDQADPQSTQSPGEESPPASSLESVGQVERSQVEIRVAEILTELEASAEPEGAVVDIPDTVLFDFDSADLKPGAADVLGEIAEVLVLLEDAPAQIRGHTDDVGEPDYNLDLSQRRADAVVAYLVDAGVDAGLLTAEGVGEAEPVAPNRNPDGSDSPEGRAENRRVEVVLPTVDLDELAS